MFDTALVTGATSGIGEALCRLLASKNIPLIITGRDENKLNLLKNSLQVPVEIIRADLTLSEGRSQVIEAIRRQTPALVINNAGSGLYGEIFNHSTESQMAMMSLNADALLELTIEAVKALKKSGKPGVILNVSSAASQLPFPCFSLYSATKAFVNQLSVSLDEELKRYGIRVLVSCPGMVRTQFRQRAAKSSEPSRSTQSMDPEEAAEHIWWQITTGKQFYMFNWKYRLSILFAKCLPRSWLMRILKRSIKKVQ